MKNIMTVDLEEWYHQNLTDSGNHTTVLTARVEQNTEKLLHIFNDAKVTATFFCLGETAQKHPGLIRKIHEAGHEIASHGFRHELVYRQNRKEFFENVKKSKDILSDISGREIKGFRSPSWSITENSLWALEVISELGFIYDSSIFPMKNFLYGIPDSPQFCYEHTIGEKTLLEVPPSTFSFLGKRMGFSGGFYFRAFPLFFTIHTAKSLNKQSNPVVFYIHPHEIDMEHPRENRSLRDRLILYYGIERCEKKLIKTFKEISCVSIEQYYNL